MKKSVILFEPVQAHRLIMSVWTEAKPWVMAGHRLELRICPARRNGEQNAKLHAELSEIAATKEWAGEFRSVEVWKRLITAAWLREHEQEDLHLPAIDGKGMDVVFRHTSDLSIGEMSELIEYVVAWKAMHCTTN